MRLFARLRYRLRGWKTVWVNATVGLPSALYFIYLQFATVDFTPIIPAKYVALFLVAFAVLGVVLRIITTGPVGAKGDAAPNPQSVKAGD